LFDLIQLDGWCNAGSVLLGMGELLCIGQRLKVLQQNKVTASKIIC